MKGGYLFSVMAVLACGWTTDVSARTPPLNANPAGGNVGAASRSTLNRRPAQRKTLFDGPPTEGSGNVGGGNDGQAWSYVLGVGPNGTVWARSAALAAVEFTGKPSSVINRCIAALPHSGGTLFLRAGVYTLESPIVIDRSSVELRGENAGGDLFFASDSYYNGFRNKTATVLVAEGIDAIQVGNGMVCRTPNPHGGYFMNGTHCLVLGIAIRDLAISGLADPTDAPLPNLNYSAGAGIRVQKADTIRFDNLDIRRKEHGVMLGQNFTEFQYDHVIDVLTINNLYLGYNLYGLWQTGWVSNVRIRNIFGYENQRSLIHADTKYDWLVDGVMSQADGNYGVSETDAPIYVTSRQDVTIRHVTVASNLNFERGIPSIPLMYIGLGVATAPPLGEWYRGHIKLDTLTLFGTNSDAIKVVGTGLLDIRNLHAGGTGYQSFYGGPATIAGRCVNAAGPDTDVTLHGGFCHSNLTEAAGAPREVAVFNLSKVADVRNLSPVGLLPTPFHPQGTVGLGGSSAAPVAGSCYTVRGVDIVLGLMGGEGVEVELRDAEGQLIFGNLSSLGPTAIPVGWDVCFVRFSAAPTVRVGGN